MSRHYAPPQESIILESEADPQCYRCDDPIDPGCWIRLEGRLGPAVAAVYEVSSQPCCLDCVAAIGLLELTID